MNRSTSTIPYSNIVPEAGGIVFRRDSVAGRSCTGRAIPGSPTGLKYLTPDVVPLGVASGDEYPTRDDRKVGGLWTLA